MNQQHHWEQVYKAKAHDQVSWFRPHLETSLALVERATSGNREAAIADIGGGPSTLVDDLRERGYSDLTVVDISERALELARARLREAAAAVRWILADARQLMLPAQSVDVWHDRAVFHFLTAVEQRRGYVRAALQALKPGGHIIVSTFGPEGPERCSGLEVVRYDSESLHQEFGGRFRLIESSKEAHQTPWGSVQQFLYCHCLVT
jgi:SAM-dependent methyltransferase